MPRSTGLSLMADRPPALSHAQRILVAGYAMLERLDRADITIPVAIRIEYHRRIEAWCNRTQVKERR